MMDRKHYCIVMPYRYGDCILALPIAKLLADRGHQVSWVAHAEFMDLFDGVSYVHPVKFDGDMQDVNDAMRVAKFGCAGATPLVVRPNWGGNAGEHFDLGIWVKASEQLGEDITPLRATTPLIFDRRDAGRERDLIAKMGLGPDEKPILFYFGPTISTPHPNPASMEQWLRAEHERRGDTRPLVKVPRADHLYDLIGLMERSSLLVCTDTALTHLAKAARLPVVDIVQDNYWHQPAPASHWRAWCTISESITDDGRARLAAGIWPGGTPEPPAPAMPKGRAIIQVAHRHSGASAETLRREAFAQQTWDAARRTDGSWIGLDHRTSVRSSRDIGDPRAVPYVRDVFDFAVSRCRPVDYVLFLNTDVSLVPDAGKLLRTKLAGNQCCYSHRVDSMTPLRKPMTADELSKAPSKGIDLWAFTPAWWRQHRNDFPDLLLGCEGFDFVLARVMDSCRRDARMDPPICYHEWHDSFWSKAENQENPGQKHNWSLCRTWATANGHERHLSNGERLFQSEPRVA